jgi:hypothetical protein
VAHQYLGLDLNTMRLAAAREAIQRLGLLKVAAESIIFHLNDGQMVEHPRALCTAYRKDGEQLSNEQKKALGLRSNAFLSLKAFDELTDNGRADPLKAHETVLLRATFTLKRYRSIWHARSMGLSSFRDEYKYDMTASDCPICKALDGTITKGDDALVFPPDGCVCDTANYTLQPYINWLADID